LVRGLLVCGAVGAGTGPAVQARSAMHRMPRSLTLSIPAGLALACLLAVVLLSLNEPLTEP
jgi:hypothetical protein